MNQKHYRQHHAHIALIAWAHWHVSRFETCALSYPSSTAEHRASQGALSTRSQGRSRDPELMMRPHVAAVDRALKRMDDPTKAIVQWKYLEPGIATEGQRITRWRQSTGLSHGSYYKHFDRVRDMVADELDKVECAA